MGIVLHELGHAIAMWVTGGSVTRIVITPFSWSYTYYGSAPKYPQFADWSGLIIGSILSLLIVFMIRKQRSPYVVPFLFAGFAPLLNGGGYFLVDALVLKRGDAASLIASGVPMSSVAGAGLLFLAVGLYLVIRNIYRMGIEPQDAFGKRLARLAFGVLPYFIFAVIYSIIRAPENLAGSGIAILIVFAAMILASGASMKYGTPADGKVLTGIKWRHAICAVVLGVGAIVIPHLIF